MIQYLQTLIYSLEEKTVRKLAIRSLRRGIGSMDYIEILLIAEDDLDEDTEVSDDFGNDAMDTETGRLAHKVINIKAHPATAILKPQLGASVEIAGQWLKKSRTNVANKKSVSHFPLIFLRYA